MNVLFHTATAVVTIALVADSGKSRSGLSTIPDVGVALGLGIFFHAILDYMPHCYPLHSKPDAIISLILMVCLCWKANKGYKVLVIASCIGNVLPDIIDLAPAILNKLFHLHIILMPKIFPWHWRRYSGSIYTGGCSISWLNYGMITLLTLIICWYRNNGLKIVFQKNK